MSSIFKKFAPFIFLLFFLSPAWGWNAPIHRLIAEIAYQQLNPVTRQQVDQLTSQLDPDFPPEARFLYLSTRADQMRRQNKELGKLHFINLPDDPNPAAQHVVQTPNIVTGLEGAIATLSSPQKSPQEKAEALALLLHLVGDIHQPLHTINRFTPATPLGDEGGNAVNIEDESAKNLHQFWDQGAGILRFKKRMSNRQIATMARYLMRQYPPEFFGNRLQLPAPQVLAQESFKIAQQSAYPENGILSTAYREQSKKIALERIVLAGYRLAAVLNAIVRPQ